MCVSILILLSNIYIDGIAFVFIQRSSCDWYLFYLVTMLFYSIKGHNMTIVDRISRDSVHHVRTATHQLRHPILGIYNAFLR